MVGTAVGSNEGRRVGIGDGLGVGIALGRSVGEKLMRLVGMALGARDGVLLGDLVGAAVLHTPLATHLLCEQMPLRQSEFVEQADTNTGPPPGQGGHKAPQSMAVSL